LIYHEEEYIAGEVREKRKKIGKFVFFVTLGILVLMFLESGREINKGAALFVLFFNSVGYWQMTRVDEFDDSDGKWHFYIDDEKLFLLKPDASERAIYLVDIVGIDHIVVTGGDHDDDYYYLSLSDESIVHFRYGVMSAQKIIDVLAKFEIPIRTIKGRHKKHEYEDSIRNTGSKIEDFYSSDKYLIGKK